MASGINQIESTSKQQTPSIAKTDLDLIRQAREGGQSAFKELVERYEQQVAATVIGMLGDGPDADEVGQETFVRFYKSLDKFRAEAKLGTYLTRIAINLSLDALRKRQRNLKRFWRWETDEMQPAELIVDSEASYDQNERRDIVRNEVQALEAKHRAVVVLRMLRGYSTRETSEILDIPQGTVLSRLSRGLDKLKERLAPIIDRTDLNI
ncbi:RNA polymerase sigma factor [bacterium]|nr:RNA polymerase sigma factor [bacterium]